MAVVHTVLAEPDILSRSAIRRDDQPQNPGSVSRACSATSDLGGLLIYARQSVEAEKTGGSVERSTLNF